MRYWVALLLAGVSGGAALSHELLWTRRLIDLLGASAESSTRVLGCFFLGLALGAACSTGLARRVKRPWRVVAGLEAGIAVLSVPALTLPAWTGWIWPWLGPDRLVGPVGAWIKLGVSVLIMIPPAFLMGMILPLMARAVLGGDRTLGRQGVWLYAVNTLGGVVGLLLTTVVVLPWVGVSGAMVVVAGLNLWVAAIAGLMDRFASTISRADQEAGGNGVGTGVPAGDSRIPPLVVGMAFASGVGVLGVEVLGMHLFMQVAPSAIHAVAAVLAAIIGLLAVSAFLTPVLTPRFGAARELLVPVLMLTGLATACCPLLFMWLTNNMVTIAPGASLLGFFVKMTGYVLGAIGPGILLAGLVLPLVFVWFEDEGADRQGRRWGWLLAVNGVGGIVGAEVAQRLVMPVVGMHGGLGVFGLGYAVLAGAVVVSIHRRESLLGPVWRPVGVMMIIAVIAVGWLLRLPLIHPAPTQNIRFKTLDIAAGPEGVVAVTESDEFGRGIVMFNQYMLGSTAGMTEERRQAHLPLVLHRRPRSVAFIGVATGITAGASLMHDEVGSVTAIELSRLVARACKLRFSRYTQGLFSDPRAQVVVEDGRTYLASCEDRFDVVAGDLFLPWRAGVGRLYSLEHFQAVRRSLRLGGLFCQMLPMYQMSRQQLEVVLATFLEVFPRVHLFRLGFDPQMPVFAIVGFKDGDLDWRVVELRCGVVRSGGRVRDRVVRHLEGVAMLYLGSMQAQDRDARTVNTLGNAWVELTAGKDFVTGRWDDDYFMNGPRWLGFEEEMGRQLVTGVDDASIPLRWSRLGSKITQWNYLRGREAVEARPLGEEIRASLPSGLIDDNAADPTSWVGWSELTRGFPLKDSLAP